MHLNMFKVSNIVEIRIFSNQMENKSVLPEKTEHKTIRIKVAFIAIHKLP